MGPILSYPEDEIITVAGLDVAVFLRLLRYGTILFGFATLWCCIVLIPINATVRGPGRGVRTERMCERGQGRRGRRC